MITQFKIFEKKLKTDKKLKFNVGDYVIVKKNIKFISSSVLMSYSNELEKFVKNNVGVIVHINGYETINDDVLVKYINIPSHLNIPDNIVLMSKKDIILATKSQIDNFKLMDKVYKYNI